MIETNQLKCHYLITIHYVVVVFDYRTSQSMHNNNSHDVQSDVMSACNGENGAKF